MPELSKAGRMSGAQIVRGIVPGSSLTHIAGRHYDPDVDLEGACAGCGQPMVAALVAVDPRNATTHPTCQAPADAQNGP